MKKAMPAGWVFTSFAIAPVPSGYKNYTIDMVGTGTAGQSTLTAHIGKMARGDQYEFVLRSRKA